MSLAPIPASMDRMEQLADPSLAPLQYMFTKPLPDATNEDACLEYAAEISAYMGGSADHKVSEEIGTVIELRHVFAHKARVRNVDDHGDWDGTYNETDRLVLIDNDGESYECQSDGVIGSILAIFQLPGIGSPQTWKKPLRVVVKQVAVRDKWRTFKIQVLPPPKKTSK